MKKLLLLILSLFAFLACQPIKAQLKVTKTIRATSNFDSTRLLIKKYYRRAIEYKNGTGVPMDYAKAYYYFEEAANLGDAQSVYALGYMHYWN